MTLDINTVIQNLNELLTNSVNFTDKFYDIFFNQTPMDVTIDLYNENNELVPVTIPNRAKDILVIQNSINTISNLSKVATSGLYEDLLDRPDSSGVSALFVNVASKGAKGDGVTDDTAAIQEACAEAVSQGKILWFEAGKSYIVSSELTLDASNSNKAITIFGNGATLVPSISLPNKAKLVNIAGSNIVILGLNVDGSNLPQDDPWEADGSAVKGFSAFYLTGNKIGLQGITVKNVCGDGVVLSNYSNVNIEDCDFESVGGAYRRSDGVRRGHAIYLLSHPEEACANISNCRAVGKVQEVDGTINQLSIAGVALEGLDDSSIVSTGTKVQISNCDFINYNDPFLIEAIEGETLLSVINSSMTGNSFRFTQVGSVSVTIDNSSILFVNANSNGGFRRTEQVSDFTGSVSLNLTNCSISYGNKTQNTNYLFRAFQGTTNDSLIVEDCDFKNIYTSFAIGITATDCNFSRCKFEIDANLSANFVENCQAFAFNDCVFESSNSGIDVTLSVQGASGTNIAPKFYSCTFNHVIPYLSTKRIYFGDTNNVISVNADTNVLQNNYYAARVIKNGVLQWTSSLFKSLVPLAPCNEIKSGFTTPVEYASNNEVRFGSTREMYWESFELKPNVEIDFLPNDSDMEKVGFAITSSNKYIVILGLGNFYPGSFSYTEGFYYFTLETSKTGDKNYGKFRHYGNQGLVLNGDDETHKISHTVTESGVTKILSRIILPIAYKDFFIPSSEESSNTGREVGEIVATTLPTRDPGLHLLDGSVIEKGSSTHTNFVEYMKNLYNSEKRYNVNGFELSSGSYINISNDGVASRFVEGTGSILLLDPLYYTIPEDQYNSGSDYYSKIDVKNKDFEVDLGKIQVLLGTTDLDKIQVFVSGRTFDYGGNEFTVGLKEDSNKSYFYLSSSHLSNDILSTVEITNEGTYWVKAGCKFIDETNPYMYIKVSSNNGETWETPVTASTSSSFENPLQLRIGRLNNGGYPVLGSYDLKQFNISVGTKNEVSNEIETEIVFRGTEAPGFCTNYEWQETFEKYKVCGKYVYDEINDTVKLPLIIGFIENVDFGDLKLKKNLNSGEVKKASLPAIEGAVQSIAYTTNGVSGCFDWVSRIGSRGPVDGENPTWTQGMYNFKASRSSKVYNNNTNIVQPQAIQVFYYVVIGTTVRTDVEVDTSYVLAQLNAMESSKANVSLDNVSSNGTARSAGWTMPSDRYIEMPLDIANGTRLIAPANGYVSVQGYSTGVNQAIGISLFDESDPAANVGKIGINTHSAVTGEYLTVAFPVSKGDVYRVYNNTGNLLSVCRFYYSKGEQ